LLDFTAVYNLTILTEELSVASVTAKLKEQKKSKNKSEVQFNEISVQ